MVSLEFVTMKSRATPTEWTTPAVGNDSVASLSVERNLSDPGLSASRKCALSSALFRRVEVPLALK